jgi:hypothetical protein
MRPLQAGDFEAAGVRSLERPCRRAKYRLRTCPSQARSLKFSNGRTDQSEGARHTRALFQRPELWND